MKASILLFVISSSLSVWCAANTNKRFEQLIPVGNMAITAILFVFGVLNLVSLGFYLVIFLAAMLYVWTAVSVNRRKNVKEFLGRLLTPGMLLYFCLLMVLTVLNRGRLFHNWDEFSHWGDAVKVMIQFDALPAMTSGFSAYSSYPPGLTLFQYFLNKIATITDRSANFTEAYCYVSNQILCYSLLFPFMHKLNRKKAWMISVYVVAILLIPMQFHNLLALCLADQYIALLSGVGLSTIFLTGEEERDWLYHTFVALCCVMLVLAKDAAMLFAVALACAYVLSSKRKHIIKRLWIFVPTIGSYLIWSLVVHLYNAYAPFKGDIDFTQLIGVFLGNDSGGNRELLSVYVTGYFEKLIPIGNTGISLTPAGLIFLSFAALFGVCWVMNQQGEHGSTNRMVVAVTALMQLVVFALGLSVVYMFKLTRGEAMRLTSFERYITTAILPVWIVVVLAVLKILENKVSMNGIKAMAVICVFLTLCTTRPWVAMASRSYVSAGYSERKDVQSLANRILNICEPNARIWYISQNTLGENFWKLKFLVRPCLITNQNQWSLDVPLEDDPVYSCDLLASEWQRELLENYDYVVLHVLNTHFYETYSSLFEDPDQICEEGIYRVDKQTGMLVLCE